MLDSSLGKRNIHLSALRRHPDPCMNIPHLVSFTALDVPSILCAQSSYERRASRTERFSFTDT